MSSSDPNGKAIKDAFDGLLQRKMEEAGQGLRIPILNQPERRVIDWDELDLEPQDDWMLLDFVTPGNMTSGGVYVSPRMQDTMMPLWRVRKVGPGKLDAQGNLRPTGVVVGDVVIVDSTAGQIVELGTKKTQTVVARAGIVVFKVLNAAEFDMTLKDVNTLEGK